MLAKIIDLTKKNPILPILYLLYMALTISLVFLLLPDKLDQTDLVALLLASVKMLIYCIIMALAGLLFFTGFGNMLSIAAAGEKVTIGSFGTGLKKYILKMLLAGLLLVAIFIAFSIALSILLIPVIIIMSMGTAGDTSSISSSLGVVSSIVTALPTVFLMPFIILWFPAIFSDDIKIIEALKRGAKTGTKCYGTLLLWTLIVYLPALIYMIFNSQQLQSGSMLTPSYIAVTAVSVVLSFLYTCVIFILYRQKYQPDVYYPRQSL